MSRRPRLANPFRYFKTSPEVIRLAVLMCVRFPLSLRNVEDFGLSEEGPEVARARGEDRDRRAPFISCRDAPASAIALARKWGGG